MAAEIERLNNVIKMKLEENNSLLKRIAELED